MIKRAKRYKSNPVYASKLACYNHIFQVSISLDSLFAALHQIGANSGLHQKRLGTTGLSRTRTLVTGAQRYLVVNDWSITLFLKYMSLSRQIYSVFDADLRLLFSTRQPVYTELAC